MASTVTIPRMSWTALAKKLEIDPMTFKNECKPILIKMNALHKKNARKLWPNQITKLLKHLGYSVEEVFADKKEV